MKVSQSPANHLEHIYKTFANGVKKQISQNKTIKPMSYSCKLHDVGAIFEQQNQIPTLNRLWSRLAEFLVSCGENSLAGITYSFLIKINRNNIQIVEELATKALAIAKRQHDPVHTMARANDLKRIYKITEPGSDKHIKILYEIKRALSGICKNYESTQKRYMSVSTKMKPRKQYEIMLANIKTEIGEIIRFKDPKLAEEELQSAREMFIKLGYTDKVEKINKLLGN